MKYTKSTIAKILILFAILAGIGFASANIGRFTPTHAIVEPVYCGACHPDQIVELNATTHLPHFAGAIIEEAEAIEAGGAKTVTQAEAISGGCMMCHNTWNNRDKIILNGYSVTTANTVAGVQTKLSYNDIGFNPDPIKGKAATQYDVAVTSASQVIRLGSNVSGIKVFVQDPGASGLTAGVQLVLTSDYTVNITGVTLSGAGNASILNTTPSSAALKITYTVNNGAVTTYKGAWAELSALSPQAGAFYNDQGTDPATGTASCGNPEKGLCHAVEISVGKNTKNQMQENNLGANGASSGSGNGIYFQHDMAYTSAEYAAKQVKLCGVCHVNKLPPMTADGEPIRQDVTGAAVIRSSHGTEIINTTSGLTITSPDWAHRQVQCIRCHSHAGIGGENSITGVRSK
jgi:hypothetical protein